MLERFESSPIVFGSMYSLFERKIGIELLMGLGLIRETIFGSKTIRYC